MTSPDAVPAEDAAEQAQPIEDEEPGPVPGAERDLPLEADAADAAEQAVVVPLDDDVDRA